jgi:hypothetical protein
MNHKLRHIIQLLILYFLLLLVGLYLVQHNDAAITAASYAALLTFMTLITFGVLLLVNAGIRKGNTGQGIWLLAGLGGKFLAYLVLILLFWAVGKNLTKDFIIAFFVLYLVLTIFLTHILFKALKNN